jgi:hypothetical protein
MGIKARGIKESKRNLDRIMKDVQRRKLVRGMHAALIIGAGQAAVYTPINISTLINSQYREVEVRGVVVTGRVGYSANYAVYVHDPDVPQTFRRATAKKEFLTLGMNETRNQMQAALLRELSK